MDATDWGWLGVIVPRADVMFSDNRGLSETSEVETPLLALRQRPCRWKMQIVIKGQ